MSNSGRLETTARTFRAIRLCAAVALAGLTMTVICFQIAAQTRESGWLTPVNLSHSGSASGPTIVAGPEGSLRVFWWDRFEGLMVAGGRLDGTWSEPMPIPVMHLERVVRGGQAELVPMPVEAMPRIEGDATGQAHAFWLGEADRETGARPLLHSRLGSQATAWSLPITITESAIGFDVTTDAANALHLAYLRATQGPKAPAGVYYQRSEDGGATWSAAKAIYESRYFRLLSPETAYVRVAVDNKGGIFITWDDPYSHQASLAYLPDGSSQWQLAETLGAVDQQPQQAQLMPLPDGDALLLWRDGRYPDQCALYQVSASKLWGNAAGKAQRVLEDLAACPEKARFASLDNMQLLMMSGTGGDVLTLAVWDGDRWSEPRTLRFDLQNLGLDEQSHLADLDVATWHAAQEMSGATLIIAGTDRVGDVWLTAGQSNLLEIVFAPQPPWSAPSAIFQSEVWPGLPAIATDAEGRLHLLWSQPSTAKSGTALVYARRESPSTAAAEVRWTRPIAVLHSPEGEAIEPALAVGSNRLHAVWSGGPGGEILYSRAFVQDAHTAEGWAEPRSLPAPGDVGSWPDIAVDVHETMHVVYAVPINEGRGIYHVSSADDGENWSAAHQVFNAAAAGWLVADYPRLAVDGQGVIHVVWARRTLQEDGIAQEIYYARSFDGGETWSEPLAMAEGACSWPQIVATAAGQVHLLWNEVTTKQALWHRWSSNGGDGWTRAERIPGFDNLSGPVGGKADSGGGLHLAGVGQDSNGRPVLWYAVWDGQRWEEQQPLSLELTGYEPGVATTLSLAPDQMHVILRATAGGQEEAKQIGLWYTGRTIAVPAVIPVPTFTPRPTATPSPSPIPTTPPRPAPSFSTVPPPAATGKVADGFLPLLMAGGLAALIVAGVVGMRLWRR